MQLEYSLVARSIEREHVPVALDCGMGVIPWSPLAGGFLTGKYKREDTVSKGRLSGANPFGNSKFTKKNWEILEVLRQIALECETSLSQAALAWVINQKGVSSTLIGASKVAQLTNNLAALELVLTEEQVNRLSEVSALTPEFSDSLT